MYKHLYDKFKDWYHGGSIWLYSDPHFSDEEMKYLRADCISDDEQVKRINSKVGKNDTLIILGDIGNTDYVRKLRGYHVLIMGNHDAGARNYVRHSGYIDREHRGEDGKFHYVEKDNGLFDEIYEGPLFISEKILLSHEPIDFPYALNIHGHDHSKWYQEDDMHYNICAEHIDYTPVNLKWIVESGCLKRISTIHRATIDEATARKRKREDNNG